MKKEEIYFGDWQRLLIGNAPWEFMLEVLLRSIIIYIALLVVLRLLGKRMNAQLTISELAVMVTLGAITAVPMQLPDRGLLLGITVMLCALLFQRGLNLWAFRNRKIEALTQGQGSIIVKDGELLIEELEKTRLSKDQVFAALRTHNIQQLGQLKRVYMEACGLFSYVRQEEPKPGLSILPAKDSSLVDAQEKEDQLAACTRCGFVAEAKRMDGKECPRCSCSDWLPAVK